MGIKQWVRRVLSGGMNTDDDIRAVLPPYPEMDYTDSENTRLAAINGGYYNSRISIKGNIEITNELYAGENKCVGVYEDRENGTLIAFIYNSEDNHAIFQYQKNNIWTELCHGADLNFNPNRKITGIDVIDNLLYWSEGREVGNEAEGNPPRVLNIEKANDYLKKRKYNVYFNESDITNPEITGWLSFITIYNPEGVVVPPIIETIPTGSTLKEFLTDFAQKINDETGQITAVGCDCHLELTLTPLGKYTILFNLFKTVDGLSTTSQTRAVPENFYPSPMTNEYMDRVKYAPLVVPVCTFKNDPDFTQNFVGKKYFQFATQYVYDNNEYSCLSPISKLAFDQNFCGTNNEFSPHNYVEIDFYDKRLNDANSLSIIKNVNIYVRYGYQGEWRLVKTLERCDYNISTTLERSNIFKFYNDGSYPVQALELVSTENNMPLIATAQTFAQNRGYLGGTLEGYDNIECVDANLELTYKEACVEETGTLSGNFFIRNRAGGMTNYQPIYFNSTSSEVEYGGLSGAGFVLGPSQMTQQLDLRGFTIYSAQDPNGLNVQTVQRVPAGYGILTVAGDGNIYNIADAGSLTGIIDAMVDGEVYSTYSIELPVGKHIIRVASNLISSEPNSGMYSYPGSNWQTTSLCAKQVGTTGGSVTSFYHEAIVEITAGGTVTMDIEVWDMIPTDATINQWLFMGYMLDAEGSAEIPNLLAAPRAERQLVEEASITGGSTININSFGNLGLTDHNGFFYKLYVRVGASLAGTGEVAVSGADTTQAISYGDEFLYNASGYILDGLVDIFDYTSVNQLTLTNDDFFAVILYNHYENYSNNCRTQIRGVVKNSDGLELPGVQALCHLTNRIAITDGDGVYEILVYADLEIAGENTRQGRLLFKTGSNCCLSYPFGENLIATVTPFTPGGNYSINFPFTVSDFTLDIDGYDIEHWWKHRNNVKPAIRYMDTAGRTGRDNPFTPLFIPFITDEGGNPNQPVIKWVINHIPPVWAEKYQIVVQQNPLYNRYLQFIVGDVTYVKLWDYTTEPPTAIPTTFEAGDATEISFSLIPIVNYQQQNTGSILGYIPEKGDRITFMKDSEGVQYTQFFDYEISSRGIGTFADPTAAIIQYNSSLPEIAIGTLVELYTPKKQVETDFYYEIGEVMEIIDAGLSTRKHGKGTDGQDQTDLLPATGFIYDGDTFVKNRNMFVLDGTEPNYYDYSVEDQYIYDTDANSLQFSYGTPNIADPDYAQYFFIARVRFSGLYNTDGNKLFNGLSTFTQIAYGNCDQMFGVIQRLIRVGEKAEILAIQSHKVQPIYVNTAPLYELQSNSSTLTVSDSPLNFGIPFKSPFGTQHPESVVVDGNSVWAYDMFEAVIWYHNSADLIPISDIYKYKKKIISLSEELRDYNQTRVHITGSHDRNFEEVIWAFEFVSATEPIGGLEGGGTDPVPDGDGGDGMDVGSRVGAQGELLDFDPVTIVFSRKRDKWETRQTMYPEAMSPLGGTRFFAFKDGKMWENNINPLTCNFFGVQYNAKITVPITQFPQMIKDWYAIREKANKVWAAIEIVIPPNSRYPNGMTSRITKNNFTNFEGDYWAQFFKDMTDPSFVSQTEALQRGRELKGDVMIITLQNSDTSEAYINEIDVNFTPSEETF